MTPECYERLWSLFEEVAGLPPAERRAVLDARCAAEPGVRAELERMLNQADRDADSLLGEPCPLTALWRAEDSLLGRRVGPYEIRQRLGSGGMGEVYEAVRLEDFEQRVAVKLIKPGMDNAEILRRFREERQVLAGLRHPNIARLLDGGTLDGRPFFVMELIDGVPLDQHCRTRALPRTERLGLFLTVCTAVHYAHQNLVLHRDLKPGNILVDTSGAPKLIDFGIAKMVRPVAENAGTPETRQPFATPAYASPEQLRGKTLPNTSTDVYALGVILYELLTDTLPFPSEDVSPWEMARAVCEDEPTPPRRWRSDLPRDLEIICLKCLKKSPQDRFASVAELAEELERFLAGKPIRSRPVGISERLRLWARRRPAEAILATATGVTLAALVGFVLWDNHRLNAAWQTANKNRVAAEMNEVILAGLLDELLAILSDDGLYAGPDVTTHQVEMLQRLVESLRDRLGAEEGRPRLRRMHGQILAKMGQMHYLLGKDAKVLDCYKQALVLQRALVADQPDEADYQHDLAETLFSYALALRRVGQLKESADRGEEAVALHEALLRRDAKPRYRRALAHELHHLGNLHKATDNFAAARACFLRGRELLEELVRESPEEPRYRRSLAVNLHSWGQALAARLDAASQEEAHACYRQAEEILHGLSERYPGAADYRHELARLADSMATIAAKRGQPEEARSLYEKAISLQTPLTIRRPFVVKYRFELARHYIHLGDLLLKRNRSEALVAYDKALELRRKLAIYTPQRANYHGDLGVLLVKRARCEPADSTQAVAWLQEATKELQTALKAQPTNVSYQAHFAEASRRLVRRAPPSP
jgi:non-specific serine/threonine protein kinase/serine/threonine-protein kinase